MTKQDLKIYFAGSIRGGRKDAALYFALISFLSTFGEVKTEHVGDLELTEKGDDGPTDPFIYDRDMAWLEQCDLVIAEVTTPSLGVGYELGWAAALNKPTLCLFQNNSEKTLSAMIAGNPFFKTAYYSQIEEAKKQITSFLDNHSSFHSEISPANTDGSK